MLTLPQQRAQITAWESFATVRPGRHRRRLAEPGNRHAVAAHEPGDEISL